ncbi:MAG: hypothetical protein LBI36_04950 [Oscillospiraceae bacterium]|jgi:hypothetical protein|nr:hypothetical protein [Oscillospiraceae bacterium]
MDIEASDTARTITDSPWKNTYWFARMLLSGDRYGAIGKSKEHQLIELANRLEVVSIQNSLSLQDKIAVCKKTLTKTLSELFKPNVKSYALSLDLANDIECELNSLEDVVAFVVAVKYIVVPMNTAISLVPSSDKDFCCETAKYILDSLGETSIGRVINTWDNLGVRGCLDIERSIVVTEFTKLRNNLKSLSPARSESEDNIILTAFVQEFERRLAQKRKNRAGNSLEDISTFLFDYYKFTSHPKPDHFQTDIEVDKWFKCKDGWTIGISCKRTLRERWKQVSSADSHALSRYKIKEIWHLITYDKDLSDDKLTMLGQQRQIFYLDENTDRYKSASTHIGMRSYVRPLSRFVSDIRREQMG